MDEKEVKNIFNVFIDDIKNKSLDAIFGAVSVVLSLLFMLIGASGGAFITFIFFMNPILIGWVIKSAITSDDKTKKLMLFILAGVALLLVIVQTWQLSSGLAALFDMANLFKK